MPDYICPYCGGEFLSEMALIKHMGRCPEKPPPPVYPCPYCGATFTTMAALTSHIEEYHPPPPAYTCPYCGATFSSQAALDAHIASAHPPPVYTCPYCGATFSSQAKLEAHIAAAHPPPVFTCPECGAEFSTAAALFRHMDVAHPPPPTTYRLDVFVPTWAYGGYVEPGSGDYPANKTITLRAYPLSGYRFTGWGGDASGTSTTYNLYMNSDKYVEAYFEKVPVPVEGTIIRKELEFSGSGDGIVPVANVPQGVRAKLHVWGRNDMSISQGMGIYWFVADPEGFVAEEYTDWGGTIGPYPTDHEFISSGQFDLNKVGKYTTWIELLMGTQDNPKMVDLYIGDLCTVVAAVPEAEFRGFGVTEYAKR